MNITWQWTRLEELSVKQLYEILKLRQRVFAIEQNCVYLDTDDLDYNAWHLCAWERKNERETDATPVAYLRVLPEATAFEEMSIGRVITAPEARGKGLGKAIMVEALKRIHAQWGDAPIRISAQAYLEKFYEQFNFVKVSAPYDLCGISHYEMLRG